VGFKFSEVFFEGGSCSSPAHAGKEGEILKIRKTLSRSMLGQSAPLTEAGNKLSPRYDKGSKQLDSNNNQLDVTASGYFLKE
jgi:hypothetical protein